MAESSSLWKPFISINNSASLCSEWREARKTKPHQTRKTPKKAIYLIILPTRVEKWGLCLYVGVFFWFWHTLLWMPIKLTMKWTCRSLTRGISLLEHSVCGFCDLAAINISPMQLHSAVPSAPLLTHEVYKTRCPTMDMPGRWKCPAVMAWDK